MTTGPDSLVGHLTGLRSSAQTKTRSGTPGFLEPGLKASAHVQRPCPFRQGRAAASPQEAGSGSPCVPGFDFPFINLCLGSSSFLCV